ncbi:hypothetical protein ABLE91_23765 [Aquabacter sp. CN5-332]|uniref:hypothetical protein n=1 Tax=Aquabacter sp. CN5-332 TaxID=3156608 RepID=UPI0032B43060
MIAARVLVVALASATLCGCVTDGGQPGASMVSALTGTGGAPDPRAPAPVAAGGMLNNAIGGSLDEADRQRATNAEVAALEDGGPGTPVGWRGENGIHGTVIAGPAYQRPGYVRCRDFSHTIFIQNKPQLARGAACRSDTGTWTVVTTGV